jgi:hypothetical protein
MAEVRRARIAALRKTRSYPNPAHKAPAPMGMVIEAMWLIETPIARVDVSSWGVAVTRERYTARAELSAKRRLSAT